ncbi:MAG: hypothetical protein AAGI71_13220 [Bacteroidota bacterium]
MLYRKTTYTDGPESIEIDVLSTEAPDEAMEARHHDFIAENWPSLGAASFDGYQRFGIGAVVLKGGVNPARSFEPYEIFYAADHGSWIQQHIAQALAEAIDDTLQSYDPSRTALMLFYDEDETARAYRVTATLTPPQALTRLRALMN